MNEERYFRLQHVVLWLAVALAVFVIVQCLRELHKIQKTPIDYQPQRAYPRLNDDEFFEAISPGERKMGRTSSLVGSIHKSKKCGEFEVLSKYGNKARVRFLDTGSEVICSVAQIYSGSIRDKFKPTVFGKGFSSVPIGESRREYGVWYYMLSKCYNNKDWYYHYYGDQGITVCERWMDFKNFLEDFNVRRTECSSTQDVRLILDVGAAQFSKDSLKKVKVGRTRSPFRVGVKTQNGTIIYKDVRHAASRFGLTVSGVYNRIRDPKISTCFPLTYRVPNYLTLEQAKKTPCVFYNSADRVAGIIFGTWHTIEQLEGGSVELIGGPFGNQITGFAIRIEYPVQGFTRDKFSVSLSTKNDLIILNSTYASECYAERVINGAIVKSKIDNEVVGFVVERDLWEPKIPSGS